MTITVTKDFCDRVTNALMGETEEANRAFLYGVITDNSVMSSLASAASQNRDEELRSTALWTLGVMMAADSEAIARAAYEVARDNPFDSAREALGGDNADMARSGMYMLSCMTRWASDAEIDAMVLTLVDHGRRWMDKPAIHLEMVRCLYWDSRRRVNSAPLSVAMALFNTGCDEKELVFLARAIGEIASATEQALEVQQVTATIFLEKAADRIRYTRNTELRRELCWALSNMACDGPWADWIAASPAYSALLYTDPRPIRFESVLALSNVVARMADCASLRGDRMLIAALSAYEGRHRAMVQASLRRLNPWMEEDSENSDFDYESE